MPDTGDVPEEKRAWPDSEVHRLQLTGYRGSDAWGQFSTTVEAPEDSRISGGIIFLEDSSGNLKRFVFEVVPGRDGANAAIDITSTGD